MKPLPPLLALAAAHYGWNAWAQRGFWGYDEGGHAGQALAILSTGALPHPLIGWSSFHPPVYHGLGAAVWAVFEPWGGGHAALFALRALSALGVLALAIAVARLALRLVGSESIAWVAAAVTLFLPVAQLSGTMVGNEALAAGFAALALVAIVDLQRDPRDLRAALRAGLLAGLALATKVSGLWVVAACAVPFLRGDILRDAFRRRGAHGRARKCALTCFALVAVVAGPTLVRSWALSGTPFPMTRHLEPMKSLEARLYAGPRSWGDYLKVPLRCGGYPYVNVVASGGLIAGFNPAMRSVPCLTYTGFWYDPFGLRAHRTEPGSGVGWGVLLFTAGLAPTLLVLAGFGLAGIRVVRSRGRAPESPLVLVSVLGLGTYLAFTWAAPSLAAAKASYLLPLVAPAGVFFALACHELPAGLRRAALGASLAGAALAAVVFTTGVVFEASQPEGSRSYWGAIGRALPDSYVAEATTRLLD